MDGAKLRPCARLVFGTIALFLTLVATASTLTGQNFPRYNHVFLDRKSTRLNSSH